jgi:uncharacterized membrane protein HdeD (DUF308 family)
MVGLGVAAIAFPWVASVAVELLIGWILVISGALGLVYAFRASRRAGLFFSLLGALLSLGVGVVLLAYPLSGVLTVTLLIALLFATGGVFRILLALQLRPLDHWGWMLVSGILALILAGLILTQWPEAATWVIGVLLGIDLIFAGWTSIFLSLSARRAT